MRTVLIALACVVLCGCGGPSSIRKSTRPFQAQAFDFENPLKIALSIDSAWSVVTSYVISGGAKIDDRDRAGGVITTKRFEVDEDACDCTTQKPQVIGAKFATITLRFSAIDPMNTEISVSATLEAVSRNNPLVPRLVPCKSTGLVESNLINGLRVLLAEETP